jgi:hypothetical protein
MAWYVLRRDRRLDEISGTDARNGPMPKLSRRPNVVPPSLPGISSLVERRAEAPSRLHAVAYSTTRQSSGAARQVYGLAEGSPSCPG